MEQFIETLTLQDYNTRIVVLGTMLLGIASGIMGSFLVLRKRALLSDAVSHATLPGIGLMFIFLAFLGTETKSLLLLLLGAALSGSVSILLIRYVKKTTKLKEDAALGIALSFFFGLGIFFLDLIKGVGGDAAGLSSFIYGKTASMVFNDALLMGATAFGAIVLAVVFIKEIQLLCFDPTFAESEGYPVGILDVGLLVLVVLVTVAGLQAVGAILVVAMLVIPPAAARFWTDHFARMLVASATIGGLSGVFGSLISASFADLPAGALIVLTATFFFVLSLLFGTSRGLVRSFIRSISLRKKIEDQHLLRAAYEILERDGDLNRFDEVSVPLSRLKPMRAWRDKSLRQIVSRAKSNGDLETKHDSIVLTTQGFESAKRIVRNHRLWEVYLINYAEIAPNHVDRDADMIEHVLDIELIKRLETRLAETGNLPEMPASPHTIATS